MRPTRRGYAVLGVALAGLFLGVAFGPRSLNAVVAPALVALAAGVVQLSRHEVPSVSRSRPATGFPGETRTVTLDVETDVPVDVEEEASPGLRVRGGSVGVAADTTVEYEVELVSRGLNRLGPTRLTVQDALGLVRAYHRDTSTTPLLVYPDVRPIAATEPFAPLVDRVGAEDRQAFDSLREYVPGDALRDVNWKASAKREEGDLVVTEFDASNEGGVTVVAECGPGHADAMASAAASVAVFLLDADLLVGVTCPDGTVDPGRGEDQIDDVLDLLARTGTGDVDAAARETASVHVVATDGGVTVTVDDRTYPFPDLVETVPAGVLDDSRTDDARRHGDATDAGEVTA